MPYLEKSDPETFQDYLKDASNFSGKAEKVFLPESEADVVSILKKALSERKPVTVEGNRTGLTGGAIPRKGWIISLERLHAIGKIKTIGGEAEVVVESGALLNDLHNAVEKDRWLYAPDPTERNAALGGTIATNASGARYYKYGSTRHYVKALRAVLANGNVLDIKRDSLHAGKDRTFSIPLGNQTLKGNLPTYVMPKIKHAAGYFVEPEMDLIDLFIGQEGTLGVITQATLRLIRPPEKLAAGIAFFENEEAAWALVVRLAPFRDEQNPLLDIRALEYFDERSLGFLRPKYSHIPKNAKAAIWYELETDSENETDMFETWARELQKSQALKESWFADTAKEQVLFREFRHALPVAVNEKVTKNGFRKVATDFAVPLQALPNMMKIYTDLSVKHNVPYVVFGHIGNGHLHWNLLPENKPDFEVSWELVKEAAGEAIEFGGTVSAEHGIGKVKIPFLRMLYGDKGLSEMAELKKVFDPMGMLGRGTMFPEDLLPPL